MITLSAIWNGIQRTLFPQLEDTLGPMTDKQKQLVAILELARIEDFIPPTYLRMRGRPLADRRAMARAYVAKAVYNMATTRILIDQLHSNPQLRRICGWEKAQNVPSESVFSRAFAEFANSQLPQRVHEAMIREHVSPYVVEHVSRDSTEIDGREKATPKPKAEAAQPEVAQPKRGRGRPKKGEEPPPKEPTCIEQQVGLTWQEALKELSIACDWGTKKDSNGKKHTWKGYKLHWDVADYGIPLSVILTSASPHDSQVAIPLSKMTAERVTFLYELMDAAYDANTIRDFSQSQGRVAIIDRNGRGKEAIPMDPAKARRYNERTTVERANSALKDDFGGRVVRVRGHAKVFAHLMFGVLALTADRLLHMVA
jgi:hypothetical protein